MHVLAKLAIGLTAAATAQVATAADKPLPEKPEHARDAERPAQMKRMLELACKKQREDAERAKTETEREKALKEIQRAKCPAPPPPTM